MMAPLYWSRMSGSHCNYIDIPAFNIRGPNFHNIITYHENCDVNFKGTLWTFKQQLAWKMRVRCGISILLL